MSVNDSGGPAFRSIARWLKRQAEFVGSITVLGAGASAAIAMFGGTVPPWAPAGEFRQLRSEMDIVIAARDAQRCDDWNRRLRNATMRLAMDRGNPVEEDIIVGAREEIRRTPNCVER